MLRSALPVGQVEQSRLEAELWVWGSGFGLLAQGLGLNWGLGLRFRVQGLGSRV